MNFFQIFSFVSVTFVLLSLTVFVLETHPFFKQDMTAEDYADYYHVDLDDLLKNWEGDRPPGAPVRVSKGSLQDFPIEKC